MAIDAPSELEESYREAMSRPSVVKAYSTWNELTEAEELCLRQYVRGAPRVLDLGCGAGRLAGFLSGTCQSYVGIDASSEMINSARQRHPEMDFHVADMLNLTFPPDSFDLILLMHNVLDSLHPFKRRTHLVRKCAAWLSANGMLIGSSHLLGTHSSTGYYAEDYHGAMVSNYRSSLPDFIREIESSGLEVLLAMKDFRGHSADADWSYAVARRKVTNAA